jgi:hypothetical protein
MATIRQVLADSRIAEVPQEQGNSDASSILCFSENDSIGRVLRKFASEGLVSALVLHATASASAGEPADEASRSLASVQTRDIMGFVDFNTILHSLLRGALSSVSSLLSLLSARARPRSLHR